MTFKTKWFQELNIHELYAILRARSDIFVVEQNCVYADVDGVDIRSLHIFAENENGIEAYLRVFEDGPDTVRIGRVLTVERGAGHGAELMRHALKVIPKTMKCARICLEAQVYARGFYEKFGFSVCSEPFVEDGIPHIRMVLNISEEQTS